MRVGLQSSGEAEADGAAVSVRMRDDHRLPGQQGRRDVGARAQHYSGAPWAAGRCWGVGRVGRRDGRMGNLFPSMAYAFWRVTLRLNLHMGWW